MSHPEVLLPLGFVLALVLSVIGALLLAHRYRAAMRTLMSAPLPASFAAAQAESAVPRWIAPRVVTAAQNRRAAWLLTLLLIGLSLLVSASAAAVQHTLLFGSADFSIKRVAVLVVVHIWPVVPVLGLVWRWTRWRIAAILVVWFVVSWLVMQWRSITPDPLGTLLFLAIQIGPPMVLIGLLCLGSATRAIAPWLLPLMLGFVAASLAGGEFLAAQVERNAAWVRTLAGDLGATGVITLALVLPWLIAWGPLRWLGRALARAYANKQISELGMLLMSVWGIALLYEWMGMAPEGKASAAMLLPLGWIVVALVGGWLVTRGASPGPTLLVLRVFQHDAQVRELFDTVIERWRPSGNTVLIAGTDLLDRMLDAGDIFAFLDGRLESRFIRAPGDIAARIAAFDLRCDHDGRHRVNECYCHDMTWQQALAALVRHSDVVLMDLRGFQAHNAGCAHELAVLAAAPRIARVVVLVDASTDRAAAHAAAAGAPAGRFVWLETARIDRRHARRVLGLLFVAPLAAPGSVVAAEA